MKAKFKLGNLLEVCGGDDESAKFVKVEGIITTCDGYKYLTCDGETVCEDNVEHAYREIVARKVSSPKKRKAKPSKSEEPSEDQD